LKILNLLIEVEIAVVFKALWLIVAKSIYRDIIDFQYFLESTHIAKILGGAKKPVSIRTNR